LSILAKKGREGLRWCNTHHVKMVVVVWLAVGCWEGGQVCDAFGNREKNRLPSLSSKLRVTPIHPSSSAPAPITTGHLSTPTAT
jgi:hypothetical protein